MVPISRIEEVLLLMVCKSEEAYAMQIREEVKKLTGKQYSIGGIYVPLDRLVEKGFLEIRDEPGDVERMGRPRRMFNITNAGLKALRQTRELERNMWDLPDLILERIDAIQ